MVRREYIQGIGYVNMQSTCMRIYCSIVAHAYLLHSVQAHGLIDQLAQPELVSSFAIPLARRAKERSLKQNLLATSVLMTWTLPQGWLMVMVKGQYRARSQIPYRLFVDQAAQLTAHYYNVMHVSIHCRLSFVHDCCSQRVPPALGSNAQWPGIECLASQGWSNCSIDLLPTDRQTHL